MGHYDPRQVQHPNTNDTMKAQTTIRKENGGNSSTAPDNFDDVPF